VEKADMHLADALSKTNLIAMVFVWVALPEYRKYLSDPIKGSLHKIFISPLESILHGKTRNKS
jgi:hypothetical protein